MNNNPYVPGDPYSYDLKWVVDHMLQWDAIKDQAAEARDTAVTSAESALHDADRAQESMERAETAAESAENYAEHIADPVAGLVTSWLAAHVDPDTGYVIDDSLTIEHAAADAKAVGDALALRLGVASFDGGTALGSQTVNTICRIYQQASITDLPAGVDIDTHICWLYTAGTGTQKHQMFFVPYQHGFYQRIFRGGAWSSWDGINASNSITITSFDGVDTLGDQSLNTICRVYQVEGLTDQPDGVELESYPGWLWTYGVSNKHQVLFYPHLAAAYQRIYRSSGGVWSWTAWSAIGGGSGGGSELKVLVIGNSFDQDVFAYVPPILQGALPNITLKMSVLYEAGATYADYATMYTNSTPFTTWNEWRRYHWIRHQKSNNASLSLGDALNLENWDIIIMQPSSAEMVNSSNIDQSIADGRDLFRIIQGEIETSTQLATIAFVGRPTPWDDPVYSAADMTDKIIAGTDDIMKRLGFIDYVPIAAAIGSARTNSALNALGDSDKEAQPGLMYDQHLQNGIGDLIAAYCIVLKILEWTGHKGKGVYGSTFVPDSDTLTYINAVPGAMTHGLPVGVTEANIQAAQEIATLAVRNPSEVIDCADIVV